MTSLNSKSIRELYLAIDYASEFLIAYSYDEVKNLRYSIPTHQLGLDPIYIDVDNRLSPTINDSFIRLYDVANSSNFMLKIFIWQRH